MSDHPTASGRLLVSYEAEFDLDETQRAALALAGEHLDAAERLDTAVREHGVMLPGSAGQLVVNPAVSEARQQRAAAWTVLRSMLPTDAGTDADSMGQAESGHAARSAASLRASRAATARWDRARAASGRDAA